MRPLGHRLGRRTPHRHTPEVRLIRAATRWTLLGLAMFCGARAVAYNPLVAVPLQERPPGAIRLLIEGGLPLSVLGSGWAVATALLVVGVIRPRTWTTLPAVCMCTLFAFAHTTSWANGLNANSYIYALTFSGWTVVTIAGGYLAGRALALAELHDKAVPR